MTVQYDPLCLATHNDPYPAYARLRREAPLYRNDARGFTALSRHADVAAALDDRTAFASGAPDLDDTDRFFGLRETRYVAADSERHTALRRALRTILGPRAVAELAPDVSEIADRLLDSLPGGGPVDLAGGFARRLPVLVTCRLLGLPESDEPQLARLVDSYFARDPGVLAIPAAAGTAYGDLRRYCEHHLRHPPGTGRMRVLTGACADGVLSESEAVDAAAILIAAGIKTTSTLIGTMLMLLAGDAGRAPDDATAFVEEALRYDAPAQYVSRVTTRAVTTPHGTIPARTRVLLLLGAANRDETRYDDPDRFDAAREARRHLAFGSGLHFCSGSSLARLEARLALEAVTQRSRGIALAGTPERIYSPAERELARLPCRWR